jgi:hypothetical protein
MPERTHTWVTNAFFVRVTGLVKVCLDCGLGLAKGERLIAAEKVCPGSKPERRGGGDA